MLASEIFEKIRNWLKENAVQDGESWRCKRCNDIIYGQGKYLPVHELYSIFKGKHGGFGEVKEIVFPYCRNCDKNINHFSNITCIDY
jgi:hypothetical protein